MLATRVRIGQIGIGTFNPQCEVIGHEQVENSIDAIGCDALAPRTRKIVRNIICGRRSFVGRKFLEYGFAHPGPLFTRSDQRFARRPYKVDPGMFMMSVIVTGHLAYIGASQPLRQSCF